MGSSRMLQTTRSMARTHHSTRGTHYRDPNKREPKVIVSGGTGSGRVTDVEADS